MIHQPFPFSNDLSAYLSNTANTANWTPIAERVLPEGSLLDGMLTSQTWRGIVWKHRLHVYLPNEPRYTDTAMLYIGQDYIGQTPLATTDLEFAKQTGMVYAHLYDVPNQPLFEGRIEDELISYTLTQYLDTQESDYPLLYPMVRSAIAAMELLASSDFAGNQHPLRRFLLQGASKRGWTTWLTAAVSPNVVGIMPEVFDNLNFFAQLPHQVDTLHNYSEMIDDYTDANLQERIKTPLGSQLVKTLDPYYYLPNLQIPKLLLHATNDRYWATDATSLYWNHLPAPKFLCYTPNSGHSIPRSDAFNSTRLAFVHSVAQGKSLSEIQWEIEVGERATLKVVATGEVKTVLLWSATSPNSDFRDSLWVPQILEPSEAGQWVVPLEQSAEDYVAVFAEVGQAFEGLRYKLSTQIQILTPR